MLQLEGLINLMWKWWWECRWDCNYRLPSRIFVPEVTKIEFLVFILVSSTAEASRLILFPVPVVLLLAPRGRWSPLAKEVVLVFIGVTARLSNSVGDTPDIPCLCDPEFELAISSLELDCSEMEYCWGCLSMNIMLYSTDKFLQT